MEEIILTLEGAKIMYERDIAFMTKDIEHESAVISAAYERIHQAEERLNTARAFIDQYDEAIRILRES